MDGRAGDESGEDQRGPLTAADSPRSLATSSGKQTLIEVTMNPRLAYSGGPHAHVDLADHVVVTVLRAWLRP